MKRLLLMVSLFMMSQTVFSDIIETRVTLPDDLGTGIMYLNDKQKKPGPGGACFPGMVGTE